MWTIHQGAAIRSGATWARGLVDNVDNMFLSYPHDPQKRKVFAEREKAGAQSVGQVDNLDTPFSIATAHHVVYLQR